MLTRFNLAHHLPRGLLAVRADAASDEALAAAFETFKQGYDARLRDITTSLDAMAMADAAFKLSGGGAGGAPAPTDPDYTKVFSEYFRTGRGIEAVETANAQGLRREIRASFQEGTNSAGGYLAPIEWDRKIQQAQVALSPIRGLSTVRTTAVGAFSTLWNNNQWGSGWVGETASRPNTTNPAFSSLTFSAGEIYANPTTTQWILDDSQLNLEEWIGEQVATEFSKQEGIAFLAGDGVNKPFGLLQYVTGGAADARHPGGNLDVVASGAASAFTGDGLINFYYGLTAPYRQNATWVMSSLAAAAISTLKDGQGNYLWRDSIIAGQPASILGRPVVIDENMPAPAANSISIAFGDFKAGYLINDRIGIRIIRDNVTVKGFVQLYTTKRLGAGVLDPRAIRLMKIAAS